MALLTYLCWFSYNLTSTWKVYVKVVFQQFRTALIAICYNLLNLCYVFLFFFLGTLLKLYCAFSFWKRFSHGAIEEVNSFMVNIFHGWNSSKNRFCSTIYYLKLFLSFFIWADGCSETLFLDHISEKRIQIAKNQRANYVSFAV